MKILSWAIKIIPIITIYQGVTSGGAQIGPFLDTAKVALTQYEVAKITNLVIEDINATNGKVISPLEFSNFLKDTFHDQYSVLAREIKGDKTHDLSKDIWGLPFEILLDEQMNRVRISSSGPDGKIDNKDDVLVDFDFEFQKPKVAKVVPAASPEAEVVETPEPLINDSEDREPASIDLTQHPAYNEDGFDKDGFDRDGYDINGVHRDEHNPIEVQTSENF